MSLFFNKLFRFVIAFLPRSKCLLISWLQSPFAVILEPKIIKSVTVSIISPSVCHGKDSDAGRDWGAGGEGDDRGWDGWMASLTRWTWVSENSGSWWWTGRPGVLRFMGSQRVGHDWATDLIWSYLMGQDAMILVFWMLSFKPTFSLSSFTLIKRLFSSSLSVIRVVSSVYLRLLTFLLEILIPGRHLDI